eukprot:scaffold158239_cov19-Prasinocladus_malaysianus.AAC.2
MHKTDCDHPENFGHISYPIHNHFVLTTSGLIAVDTEGTSRAMIYNQIGILDDLNVAIINDES